MVILILSFLFRFFVLLFVYLIAGILIKKYKMGVESMPEMVPNYEFWAGIPSLVKVTRGLYSNNRQKPELFKVNQSTIDILFWGD